MLDPKVRQELAKLGRLWALALVCAATGAGAVSRSGSVKVGVVAFLSSLVVLGPVLFLVERRLGRRRRDAGPLRP